MISYSDAVQALAESVVAPDMSRQEKIDVAKSILSRNGASREVSIDLSDDAFRVLRSYLSEIQRARDAEIGRNLEASLSNAKRLSALRDELKQDLSRASSEDDELEQIARRLQDSSLGKIASKEEDQINELGRKLEKLDEKGKEVEGLENRLEAVLAEHGLEGSNIDSELQKRGSKVSRLLENHSGDPDTVDVDAIVDAVADEEALLGRAEAQNSSELKNDLEKLSEIYVHKETESAELDNVEEALQDRRFGDAEDSLDQILTERDAVLDGDTSNLKDIHRDLEESMEISSGLKKLFNQVNLVESRDDIDENEFYTKLADRLDFSDKTMAQQYVGKLQKDYGDMKDEIGKIEGLKEHSLERDKSNYEKIKQIDQEDSELRREASSMEAQQKLKDIHEKLQRLGYELENEISVETGGEASDSSADTGTDDSKVPGPDPSSDPWIISLSDIETNPGLFEMSLSLVNKKFDKPIAHKDDGGKLKWSGNNYKLIINGDLIQHGRHGEKEESRELIEMLESLVSSAEDSSSAGTHPVQFTVGNHDVNLVFGEAVASFPRSEELNQIGSFPETYQRWIRRGIVRMVIPGYNTTYVHAGQRHNWDSYEINRANEILENISAVDISDLASPNYNVLPDEQGLAETTFQELDSMKEGLDHESVEFSNIGDLELEKLFGAGATSLGDGTGENKHAGMIWARPPIVKDGPQQVVGHTGQHEPKREGNLVLENTMRHRIPSVIIEKPGSITGIWRSMRKTGKNSVEWDKIEQKSL